MATLVSWGEDPLKKKLQSAGQAKTTTTLGQTGVSSAMNNARNILQSQPKVVARQNVVKNNTATNTAVKTPFKATTNTITNNSLKPLSLTSSSTLQKITTPQLNLQTKSSQPKLNTLNQSSNTSLATLTKDPLKQSLDLKTTAQANYRPKQTDNTTTQLNLERSNQAKQRYDALQDNDNEFWTKYKSAMELTNDKYKNLFGESIQKRSTNALGNSLKKMATSDGTLPSSGEDFVNKYRSLSNDDKWDVWQNLQKAKTTLTQAIGTADDKGEEDLKNAYGVLLAEVSLYDDLIANEDRGKKSFGKSFSDWITSGGIVGNMSGTATNTLGTLSEIMGNKGGAETAKAIAQSNATQNYGNNGFFDAVNFGASTVGNIAANMVTGGTYGLVNSGLGLADSASSAITDRERNYYADADGNLTRENQSTTSKLAGVGNAGLSAGLTVAGMKGVGPNINFKEGQTLQGLLANKNYGEIGKALGKYAAKELPWAVATTAASQGISALGGDKSFTDGFGEELANNIVGDLAVDLAGAARQGASGNRDLLKPGDENDSSALQRLQQLGYKINDELNERGGIGLTTKMVDGDNTDANKPSLRQSAKSSLETLRDIMTGNNQRLAYAGGDDFGHQDAAKQANNSIRTDMTIVKGAAPDGSDLVKVDNSVFDGVPNNAKAKSKALREFIQKNFQGKKLPLNYGKDGEVIVTTPGKKKVTTTGGIEERGRVVGNLDEVLQVSKLDPNEPIRPDTKNHNIAKDGFEYRQSYVDVDGDIYKVRSNIGLNDGEKTFYTINKYNDDKKNPPAQLHESSTRSYGGNSDTSVSQNPQDVNTKNQSKFSTDTATRSQELSDDFRTQLKTDSNDNSKSYEVVSDKTTLDNTTKFMDSKTLTEAEPDVTNRLNKKLGTADKQDISDALAVVKKLEQKGDTASFERAEQIIDKISQHATKSGQSIQALSLLSNKTPEGLLYGATKELKKNGVEITSELRKQLQGNIKSIVEERSKANTAQKALESASQKIDDAIASGKTTDFTKLIQDMKDAGKRYRNADDQLSYSYARLGKTVADKTPQSAGDIYSSLIKGGMLSAPTTHGKNITSNATFSVMKKAADLVGVGVDQVASIFTGKRATSFALRGEVEGATRGTKYALTTLKTGLEEGADTSKYSSGNAELRFKNKVVDTVLGKPNRVVFRLMSAGDKSFRYAAQMNSLYEQAMVSAKNRGLTGDAREAYIQRFVYNPSTEALSKAMDVGEKAVLGQQNKAASTISGLVQGLKNSDKSGVRVLGTFIDSHIVPFVKVPTNFLTEAMSYTPLQLGAEMSHQIDSIKSGQGFDQASFSKNLGKVAVGSGIIAALAVGEQIADAVEISGDYPEDSQEQARWQTEGIQENSIKIGDRWYKLEAFGPFALFAGAGVNFKKSLDQGMGALDATTTALASFTSALADQSFLTGISDLTDLMTSGTDLGTAGTSWVRSQASSLVPNIVKKAASATDPYQRAYDSHAGLGTNVAEAITGSIPGLRQATLDKKVDVYGNELKNGSFISGFLDPTGSSKALQSDNTVIQEVARLKQVAEDNATDLDEDSIKLLSATPNKVSTNFSSGGEKYTLTDKQARELQTLTGQKIMQVYTETMQSQAYNNASDLDKAAMLKQARTAATSLAKNEFANQNDFSQSQLTGDAKKLANGTFVANASADGSSSSGSHGIEINDTIGSEYKQTLNTYNSMNTDEWEEYLYSTAGRDAEYKLAQAKYENNKANGELTEVEDLKRQKELRKLKVSQLWDKSVRDAYTLAGSRTDMQGLLGELDNRDEMVGYLNALNRAMYDAGVITASTYKSRNRNINNLASSTSGSSGSSKSKSAYSSAAKTALSAYTKALASGNSIKVDKSPSMPSTSRKMSAVALATSIKKSNLGSEAKVSVKKGIV